MVAPPEVPSNLPPDLPLNASPPPIGEILKDTSCVTNQLATLDAQLFANTFVQNVDWKYGERTDKGDTIVFVLINNEVDYEKYVSFYGVQTRPIVDFSKYSLLGHALFAINCVEYKYSTLKHGCEGYVYAVNYWRGNCDQVTSSSNLLIVQKPDQPVKLLIKYN